LEVRMTIGGVVALVGREHFEEEGLELVVGPVDLVDKQDCGALAQGAKDRPGEQEPLVEERLLDLGHVRRGGSCVARRAVAQAGTRLDRPQVEDLPGEVPVVEGLRRVDALVALQSDQRKVQPLREGLRQSRLAGAGLPLEQEGSAEPERQEGHRRQRIVRQVTRRAQHLGQLRGGGDGGFHSPIMSHSSDLGQGVHVPAAGQVGALDERASLRLICANAPAHTLRRNDQAGFRWLLVIVG